MGVKRSEVSDTTIVEATVDVLVNIHEQIVDTLDRRFTDHEITDFKVDYGRTQDGLDIHGIEDGAMRVSVFVELAAL